MYIANRAKKRPWLPWLAGFLLLTFLITFFKLLGPILSPFIVAAVLAYILNPLVDKLCRLRISRTRGALWVMLFSFMLLIGLLLVIVPMLIEQVNNIIGRIPAVVDWVQNRALPWYNARFGEHLAINEATVTNWLRANASLIQTHLQKAMPVLMQQGSALAVGLGNLVLLPLLLYYFLRDWPLWSKGAHRLVPRRYVNIYTRVTGEMDTVLGEFLRGQLMVMLIMGLIYGIGLMLVGLDSGFAIGMVAGILVFIPYLGAFTGLLLATLAAVLQFDSWHGLLMVWGVFGIGQFLESFFITPQIVGDRIGLSPFWVIFSLMAFGQLMGFVGMLVALPLAAVCLVLIHEGKRTYLNSRFYNRET
ncbi:MAG: AI-2E family transporter [Alysiella sp.]|uniref:AI-2E family transporter n=1 Tax=Alysiella sp. TaxID=1872483 RepID=UPI0026DCB727|nr:AI-2E family transporter [Alysiella sp.]MDO4434530.1 AI-2E family transporter [Alysiella sp.]